KWLDVEQLCLHALDGTAHGLLAFGKPAMLRRLRYFALQANPSGALNVARLTTVLVQSCYLLWPAMYRP
ncbi:MAG: hypothetical protein LAT56_16755, partial [Wenzhouxiangella sp.]|nr:hypothetical protein [Wenzhouxiangella sp.]